MLPEKKLRLQMRKRTIKFAWHSYVLISKPSSICFIIIFSKVKYPSYSNEN